MTATEAERALTPKKLGPPPAVTEALGTLAATAAQRRQLTRAWIGMSPGANGKTRISYVWSPTPGAPGVRREAPARISLIAGGANSDLYYRGKDLAPGRVDFEVPPGPIGARDRRPGRAAGEVIDRETRKIVVPSLGLGLTLEHLPSSIPRADVLPEWQKLTTDQAAIPAIERDFRRMIGCSFVSPRRARQARRRLRRAC